MAIYGKRVRATFVLAMTLALAAVALQAREAPGRGAQASATKTVEIRNFAFHPATLKVVRGTRVSFANASKVPHTATRTNGFDTRRIAPGTSAAVRFKRSGTFAYHCKIHPTMRGKIVVE